LCGKEIRYDYLISDIEAQIGDFQSREKDLIEEVKGKERNGLPLAKVDFMKETYDRGGSKYNEYITSIAVNDEMEVRNNLWILFIQSDTGSLYWKIALGIYLQLSLMQIIPVSYSCCLWVSVISSILFLFAALVILAVAEENPELVNCVHVILMSLPKVTEQHLCLNCLLFPLVFWPGFGKAIDIYPSGIIFHLICIYLLVLFYPYW
jgi:hypothetical protein